MKDSRPIVSVIMSVYNEKEEWIMESVNSILNQTFSDLEFIIVNDNPTNKDCIDILEKVEKLDPRIHIMTNERNSGLAYSMNRAMEIAKGKYVARMDADDISLPTRLANQVEYLDRHKDISILGTQIKMFGHQEKYWINLSSPKEIKAKMFFKSCIAHPTAMFRIETLQKYNLFYDETYKSTQDYDLWSRALFNVKLANLNKILLLYRIHEKQTSIAKKKEQESNFQNSQLNLLSNLIEDLSVEQRELSKYIWNGEKLESIEDQKKFKDLVLEIIEKNRALKVFDPKEFEVPLINILVKKQYHKDMSNYMLLAKRAVANNLFYTIFRKMRKSYNKTSTKTRYNFSGTRKK